MFSYLHNLDLNSINYDELINSKFDIPKVAHLLLRRRKRGDVSMAIKLLSNLTDMQDSNPQSPYYGLWRINEMVPDGTPAVYDKNATTYIGIPLFVVFAEHSDLLPDHLIEKIKKSLSIACLFILHRNIHLQNTHITIAESFLTAACGEYFNIPEYTTYAVNLFQSFYHFNIAEGGFSEYNSPVYDRNNIWVLYLAKRYIKNEFFLRLVDIANDALWEIAAKHYHYRTNCFSGPMHRSRELFPSSHLIDFFVNSIYEKKQNDNELNFDVPCPQKYRRYFSGAKQDEYIQKIVSHGSAYPFYQYSKISTTLITPSYCIGSFCRGECWEEIMSFLGYFGTRNTRYAIKITVMHDGHEYSSAQLSMVQYMNCILGHTSFATNRGDKHIDYDNINHKIRARDLRVRFLIKGDPSKLSIIKEKNTLTAGYRDVQLQFTYSAAKFDICRAKTELSKGKKHLYFDLVLYNGKNKVIDFDKIKKAIVSWTFCISNEEIPKIPAENSFDQKYLMTKYICPNSNTELSLKSYYKPDTYENIHANNKQYIDGVLFEKYVLRNSNMIGQYSYIIESNSAPFEFDLASNKDVFNMIYALKDTPEEEIISSVKNIFHIIYANNINLVLAKRLAIQIMSYVFDFYREKSINFNTVIEDYSPFYQFHISSSPDIEAVAYHIFEVLNILHSVYSSTELSDYDLALINKIIEFINKEYNNPNLSREYISVKFGKSIYTISRAFKKISGFTYIDYLTHIRIDKAKEYLKNTNLSIEEIAKRVGYISFSSFTRTFRKKTGTTPSNFRNSQQIF